MFQFLSLVGLFLMLGSSFALYEPTAILYSSERCRGASVSMPAGKYVSDLSDFGFNNRAYSVRIRGSWLFFDLVNYNTARDSGREYMYEGSSRCVDFSDLGGAVSSVKFAGDETNFKADSITFYEFVDFQGVEEFANWDLPYVSLSGRISSFIVTGSSSWTIYDRPNYFGNYRCVHPSSRNAPYFYPDTLTMNPSIPRGWIASARKGCTSPREFGIVNNAVNDDGLHDETSLHEVGMSSNIPFFAEVDQNNEK